MELELMHVPKAMKVAGFVLPILASILGLFVFVSRTEWKVPGLLISIISALWLSYQIVLCGITNAEDKAVKGAA